MTSSVERALQLPEVLENIAYCTPLFEYATQTSWTRRNEEVLKAYRPRYLFACTLVSRLWNACFTPHLYHYCAHDHFGDNILAYQRNCHRFRRILQWSDICYPYESLPQNLVGLVPYNRHCNIRSLLLCNQGSQLRELSWLGSGHQMDTEYKDALMNLPCLEELELYNWRVDNDLIYGILRGCSRTLRELNLFGLSGCNEDLFHIDDITRSQPSDVPAGMAPWSLPHLKSLKLMLADRQPVATIRLLRLCPALETIDIYILGQRHSISNFTSELRGYCQNLQAINLQMFPFRVHNDYNPDPEVEALLFKNSCGSKGLRRAMMRLSRRMDSLMRDALLFHADNLVTLQIECHQLERGHTPKAQQLAEIQNVACLLERCKNLKGFEISNLNFDHSCVAELLTSPWACKGLEHLVIISKPSTTITSERIPPKQLQLLEYERKRIRHEAWPRRLRHHEYRDDGQGWFLKPGLTRIEFLDALIDGNWKRSLFEHMYATSSIRKARYIRLKDTEFFSQEQQFNDIEAERKEMVEEEGFVVNFRVVHPKYGVLKQHGFAPFSTKKRSPR